MSAESNKAVKPDESQNSKQTVDTSRRSFAKAGAVLAPVMMTLANRSAWGGTNICTQSGWTSFHNAGDAISSHAAAAPNPSWKTPTNWFNTSPSTAWPATFGRAHYVSNSNNFTSDLWSGRKTLTQVITFEAGGTRVLVSSVFNSGFLPAPGPNLTLLDALALNSGDDIWAYRVATVLNNAVSTVPSFLLTGQASLKEFQTFYSSCVTP